jgi:hypothetical protein
VSPAVARVFATVWALVCAPGFAAYTHSEELRDPTRPPLLIPPGKHAEEHTPRVSAVFLSSTRRIAIFEAQPVRAGDTVGAYHIDEVDVRGVRYRLSGHSAFAPLATAGQR